MKGRMNLELDYGDPMKDLNGEVFWCVHYLLWTEVFRVIAPCACANRMKKKYKMK